MLSHKKEIIDFNKNNFQRFAEVNLPLKENFDIYLFTYRKLYLDGRLFQITLDKDWIDKSPNQGLYLSKEINPKLIQTIETKSKSFLWSGNKSDPLYQALLEFNIWNGITLYDFKGDHIEIFAYATRKENDQAANFYLNNMDLLKHFRSFFKDRLENLLLEENIKSLSVDVGSHIDLPKINQQFVEKSLAFLESTQPSHYVITTSSEDILLTAREAEVLFQLSQGKRMKEVAKSLTYLCPSSNKFITISPRTAEAYWDHIKSKFNYRPRSEILSLFMKSDTYNLMQYRDKVYSLVQN